jgi:hypothetical protein
VSSSDCPLHGERGILVRTEATQRLGKLKTDSCRWNLPETLTASTRFTRGGMRQLGQPAAFRMPARFWDSPSLSPFQMRGPSDLGPSHLPQACTWPADALGALNEVAFIRLRARTGNKPSYCYGANRNLHKVRIELGALALL